MDWRKLTFAGYSVRTSLDSGQKIVADTQARLRGEIEACMHEAGYPTVLPRDRPIEMNILMSLIGRPADVQAARDHGIYFSELYRHPVTDDFKPSEEYNAYLAGLTATQSQQLAATNGECTKKVLASVSASSGSGVAQLKDSYVSAVLGDETLRKARAEWRSCMLDRGHDVQDMTDVKTTLRTLVGDVASSISEKGVADPVALDKLWKAERAIAVDMAECDIQAYAPVVDTWSKLENEWADENATAIRQLDDQVRLGWPGLVGL
jgi:hypothetical protein